MRSAMMRVICILAILNLSLIDGCACRAEGTSVGPRHLQALPAAKSGHAGYGCRDAVERATRLTSGQPVATGLLWQDSGQGHGTEVLRASFRDSQLVRVQYESFGPEYRHLSKGEQMVPMEVNEGAEEAARGIRPSFRRLTSRRRDGTIVRRQRARQGVRAGRGGAGSSGESAASRGRRRPREDDPGRGRPRGKPPRRRLGHQPQRREKPSHRRGFGHRAEDRRGQRSGDKPGPRSRTFGARAGPRASGASQAPPPTCGKSLLAPSRMRSPASGSLA
jgi:hypothetical protein